MTEAEWLASDSPGVMLTALFGVPAFEDDDGPFPGTPPSILGADSLRKLRLFGCACCRRAWARLPAPAGHRAVDLAERYADGQAGWVFGWARRVWMQLGLQGQAETEEMAGRWQVSSLAWAPYHVLSGDLRCLIDASWVVRIRLGEREEGRRQANLIRCVFGNPLRPRALNPACRTATALSIARAAYDERILPSGHLDGARLAVLSDALEEAGCADADILSHLRSPGPHVRGCWALDLVLGKV